MTPRRALRSALMALRAHRLRAALAAGSVAIGVAAVIATRALGEGAQAELRTAIQTMGTNLLVVRPTEVPRRVARREIRGAVTSLRPSDGDAIAALPPVRACAPSTSGSVRVKADKGAMVATVIGTTPVFAAIRSFVVRAGRFLEADDELGARRVAVIGASVAEQLYPGEEPVGRTLRVRGVPYEVVGVLVAKGVLADGSDEDRLVVVPLATALRRVFNLTWLDAVFVSVSSESDLPRAERAVRALLRERHRLRDEQPDDFTVQDKAKFLSSQRETVGFLALLTTGLASLALLVGGAGILALMLLSVKGRTTEIGLRVALGATPRDVLVQFLLEAALLAGAGWILGVAAGGLLALALSAATGWRVEASLGTALVSLGVTVATGLLAGTVPARRASLVPPVLALASR